MTNETAIQLVYLVDGATSSMNLFNVTKRLKGEDVDHPLVANSGHVGMVNDMMVYANIVGEYLDKRPENQIFPGVFEYEVTEWLGGWLARTAEANDGHIHVPDFIAELNRKGDIFWGQA